MTITSWSKGIENDKIDEIQKELLNYCYQIKPNYFPIVEPVMFNNKNLLIIWVPGGENRPYTCPKDFFAKKKESAYMM